ncbi:stage II sporulation protein R [Paenibacillus sp.]|jgi:stage II sporulation protein R|uniref:stage II sporulation protein R n=1 Tax=Paenibacillus sp. TaxID=58172 RepID=UPI002834CB69|nr:stage II sporulation protein R [Paenibacillus sp.]MDR0266694.1 stage II sporulation protein R [Paenibacillus sp.]
MFKDQQKEDRLRSLVKNTAIIFCIMFMLAMTWEAQKTDAAVAGGPIPQESIRLRILANSDNPDDQLVKRQIRDAVVEQMDSWVQDLENPQSLDEARRAIRHHLPELNELVGKELEKRGIGYDYNVELAVVPFPTKLYGGTVYPAGNYEALRITLGAGKGQNWWCVLFPPLCFIDAGSGEAAAQTAAAKAETGKGDLKAGKSQSKDDLKAGKSQSKDVQVKKTAYSPSLSKEQTSGAQELMPDKNSEPKVRFFLWDLLKGIVDWFKSLF